MTLIDRPIHEMPEMGEFAVNREDGAYIVHGETSELWNAAINREADVFIGAGYVDNAEELEKDYQDYVPVSEMVAVVMGHDVEAAVRIIRYDQEIGFKTLNDAKKGRLVIDTTGQEFLEENVPELDSAIEIGTIAVREELRGESAEGFHITTVLYGAILEAAERHGADWLFASFDEMYLHSFIEGLVGDAVQLLGPPIDYLGSKTIPVVINTERAKENVALRGLSSMLDEMKVIGQQLKHEH